MSNKRSRNVYRNAANNRQSSKGRSQTEWLRLLDEETEAEEQPSEETKTHTLHFDCTQNSAEDTDQ